MDNGINIRLLTTEELSFFKKQCIKLYLQAFTTGKYAQYISEIEAEKDWQKYHEIGEIYVALHGKNLAGALVAYPLKFDENLPKQSVFEVEKSVYIAELVVQTAFQGNGIGSLLMNYFNENINKDVFPNVVIRVWNENIPALSLYRNLGFKDTGISICQTKHRAENETFEMTKIYMLKAWDQRFPNR